MAYLGGVLYKLVQLKRMTEEGLGAEPPAAMGSGVEAAGGFF